MKPRLREFDFLRAIAAISVIAIHVTAINIEAGNLVFFLNCIFRYAVPLFIIMSGLLLYLSDRDSGKIRYGEFILKRFRKILVPYVLWTIIYVLYELRNDFDMILGNISGFLCFLGQHLLFGTASSHLYFILIIIQLYLLYPLLRMLVQRYTGITLTVSFAVTLMFQSGVYAGLLGHPVLPAFIIPYYIFFPTWLFFFVFGMYMSEKLHVWKNRISYPAVLSGILWLLSLGALIADNVYTKTYTSSIKPAVMLYAVTSFIFFYLMLSRAKNTASVLGKLLDWFSGQSFLIYFSHIIVMKIVLNISAHLGVASFFFRTGGILVLFVVTIVLTSLASYIISFAPFASLAGGVARRREK